LYASTATGLTNANAIISSSTATSLTTAYYASTSTTIMPSTTMPTTTLLSTTSPKTTSPSTRTSTTAITTVHPLARNTTCKKNVIFSTSNHCESNKIYNFCQAGLLV
jgi:hypothetical protein